jgi:hypothetical protein
LKKKILFVRPDYHSSFILSDELQKKGWKSKIFVGWTYPDKLLFSKENVIGLRVLKNKNLLNKFINLLFNIFSFLINSIQYKYLIYYTPPPLFPQIDNFFFKNFSIELFILKKLFRKKIIFQPSGCNEQFLKSDFIKIDDGKMCNNCGYFEKCIEDQGKKTFALIKKYSDLNINYGYFEYKYFSSETFKFKSIDLNKWNPNMDLPKKFKLHDTKKLRILHSNFLKESNRANNAKNIKGTPFIEKAIDRLIDEGFMIEKMIIENIPSSDMRFFQKQADIVIDQLIYGHWGSTAIEAMALGKPVIGYLNKDWKKYFLKAFPEYESLPIIEANCLNIYEVLKGLISDDNLRKAKGIHSRQFVESHYNPEVNSMELIKKLENLN